MKKFFKEFKEFATKGNVLDLAIGVIIGSAFQKIVTSVVNDLIMPFIGLIAGSSNLNELFFILKIPDGITRGEIVSLDAAKTLGVSTFNYGSFLSSVIDFIIMAFVIFIMIKAINKFKNIAKNELERISSKDSPDESAEREKESKDDNPKTKPCPFCLSEIPYAALKCAHCTSDVSEEPSNEAADEEAPDNM